MLIGQFTNSVGLIDIACGVRDCGLSFVLARLHTNDDAIGSTTISVCVHVPPMEYDD